MLTPRPYQAHAVSETWKHMQENPASNPLIIQPTGTGKSIVIAKMVKDTVPSGHRVLILSHNQEILKQNGEKLEKLLPKDYIGYFCAGLGRKDHKKFVTLGSIQSIYKRAALFKRIALVLIDEAHLVPESSTTTYRTFLDELVRWNPRLRVVGLTATPYRMGLGMLTDNGIFSGVAVDQSTPEYWKYFISNGYLCSLIPKAPGTLLDTSGIKLQSGDYAASAAVKALDDQGVTASAIKETIALAQDRRSWLVFAASIDYAERIAAVLRGYGIESAAIHSKLSKDRRAEILAGYKSGKIRALVNRDVLTTGFDDPKTDCIVMLRPTQSVGLHVQMLGRGTRPFKDKRNCLVLDFAGNTANLGPIDRPTVPTAPMPSTGGPRKKRITIPVMKVCPQCAVFNDINASTCGCGYEFVIDPTHFREADTTPLFSDGGPAPDPKPALWHLVDSMLLLEHTSQMQKKLVKVMYRSKKRPVYQYLGFGHDGYLGFLARDWWLKHGGPYPIPKSAEEACNRVDEVRSPVKVKVDYNKKLPTVIEYEFPHKARPTLPDSPKMDAQPLDSTG